jgi:hypothetical protein
MREPISWFSHFIVIVFGFSNRRTSLSGRQISFPIGRPLFPPEILPSRSAEVFVGLTLLSADRRTTMLAQHSSFPIGGPFCRPEKRLSRSADAFVGPTMDFSDWRTSMLAQHLSPPIGRRLCWRDISVCLRARHQDWKSETTTSGEVR